MARLRVLLLHDHRLRLTSRGAIRLVITDDGKFIHPGDRRDFKIGHRLGHRLNVLQVRGDLLLDGREVSVNHSVRTGLRNGEVGDLAL